MEIGLVPGLCFARVAAQPITSPLRGQAIAYNRGFASPNRVVAMSALSTLPPALVEAFRAFAEDPADAVEGALLVSRIVQPDTNAAWCRAELGRIAQRAAVAGGAEAMVTTLAAMGFCGARERYGDASSGCIEQVLRTRRGMPIALGVIVLGVAAQLGIDAAGINFPRRFLVTLSGLLVDPFEMAVKTEAQCRAWLRQEIRGETEEALLESDFDGAFRRAEPADIAMRMLNNLRMSRDFRMNPAHALAITDCQLLLDPSVCNLRIDRADIWLALGALDMARGELEAALTLASDHAKAHVRRRLDALPDASEQTVN